MQRTVQSLIFVLLMALTSAYHTGCGGDGPAPNGEACKENKNCESNYCRVDLGVRYEDKEQTERILGTGIPLPGGLCTDHCDWFAPFFGEDPGCDKITERCVAWTGNGDVRWDDMLCFQESNTDDDCREEWECFDGVCIPQNVNEEERQADQSLLLPTPQRILE